MNGLHDYSSVRDKPGALDKTLRRFKEAGVKVIGFWREDGHWVFKTMHDR